MKKLISVFMWFFFVLWSGDVFSALGFDYDYRIDVEQNFSYMGGFDLHDDGNNPIATRGDIGAVAPPFTSNRGESSGDSVKWFDTLLGLNGNAVLEGWGGGNVLFHARLVSQFDWLGAQTSSDYNARPTSHGAAAGPYVTGANAFALSLNQAYVKFEKFAGLPIDLTVGRQNIWLGKGFVLGSRILGHGPAIYAGGIAPSGSKAATNGAVSGVNGQVTSFHAGNLPVGTSSGGVIHAPQYADFTGFDAVRLDWERKRCYFNGGYALIASALSRAANGHATALTRDAASDNDEDLVFVNFGLNSEEKGKEKAKYPWNAEAYWLLNTDREPLTNQQAAAAGVGTTRKDEIFTTGLRGNIDFPNLWGFKNMGFFGEYARQYGVLGGAQPDSIRGRDRNAWATNTGLNLSFTNEYLSWVGLEYVHYSGPAKGTIESDNGIADVVDNEDWESWDPVFRGRHFTMISDFLEVFYLTDQLAPDATAVAVNQGKVDAGVTNRMLYILKAGFSPSAKVDMGTQVAWAVLSEDATNIVGEGGGGRNLGTEVDVNMGYKVSHQLHWTVDGGIFFPGGYYQMPEELDTRGKTDAWLVRTGFKFNI